MTKQEQVLKILELAMQYNDKSKHKKLTVNYSGHADFISVWVVRGRAVGDLDYLLSCHGIAYDTGQLQETINKIQEMINAQGRQPHHRETRARSDAS